MTLDCSLFGITVEQPLALIPGPLYSRNHTGDHRGADKGATGKRTLMIKEPVQHLSNIRGNQGLPIQTGLEVGPFSM
jgi:hypothetical protein